MCSRGFLNKTFYMGLSKKILTSDTKKRIYIPAMIYNIYSPKIHILT